MTNHAHVAGYFPEAYKGCVKVGRKKYSIIEIATAKELPPILKRFGDWVLTKEGIHNLTTTYEFGKERFNEDWIPHMEDKEWCNMHDFVKVLTAGQDFVRLEII
ncbi:MAG: hypothetical protein NTZ92_07300 [Candidatus Omnitrophica bacterium]|nr:hypothetical protein [Candidatus Omnitrophota bacterium]